MRPGGARRRLFVASFEPPKGETIADASAKFFEQLAARGHVPALEKATGTMRFDVTDGKRTTRWLVSVDKGDIAVSHRNAKADCVVRADRALFERLATGRANAMAAILRGALEIQGDQALALAFQRLLPDPPKGSR